MKDKTAEIMFLYTMGESWAQIAKALHMRPDSIRNRLRREGIPVPDSLVEEINWWAQDRYAAAAAASSGGR